MVFPKISIITPTYNQGQFIEETIQSVISQNYPNLEYMIFDGGSTDNTIEIIKKYEKHLSYWESKPDRGQAHAINKGLEKATGEIFQWLNSDDYLEKNALFKIAEAFNDKNIDAVAGQTQYFSINKKYKIEQLRNINSESLMFWNQNIVYTQPGIWLKRELMLNINGVKEKYHYAFDTEMIIRYLSKYPKINYIENLLVLFRLHDESKTVSSPEKFIQEREIFIQELYKDNFYTELKKLTKKWLANNKWSKILKSQINQKHRNKFFAIITLFFQIFKNIPIRFNRKSFGAIKRIILKKKTNSI